MGMRMDPQVLAQALARRSKAPNLEVPNELDTSMAPGVPAPVEKPQVDIDINLEPNGEIQLPPGLDQQIMLPDGDDLNAAIPPQMAEQPIPEEEPLLGVDQLSDSDKEMLLGGKPGSLTGKVRKAMLMAKNGPQA